jgi:hypothetical protein
MMNEDPKKENEDEDDDEGVAGGLLVLLGGGLALVSYSVYGLTGSEPIGWLVFGGGMLLLGILFLIALIVWGK